MWVTQTYLRSPDPNSKIHVYYLFEKYQTNQLELTNLIQKELASLGRTYRRDVTLYMPEPNSADSVQGELRAIEPLWHSVRGQLPGLLILTRPLEEYNSSSPDSFYIPFAVDDSPLGNPSDLANVIQEVTRITDGQLQWEYNHRSSVRQPPGNLSHFFDAIEIKPGIAGFRIDLKRLLFRR